MRSIWYNAIKVAERTDVSCVWGTNNDSVGLGLSLTNASRNWSGQISAGYVWNRALGDGEIVALTEDVFAPVRAARWPLGLYRASNPLPVGGAALLPAM